MQSTRTRWLYVCGAAMACAGVLIAANVAVARNRTPAELLPAAAPAAAPTTPAVSPTAVPPTPVLGEVIDTGIKAKDGVWVLYLVPIADQAIPRTHFGLMLGRRLPDGTVTADVVTNETSGSDTAPGFHAGEASMDVDGGTTPTFGYYAGPAGRITGTARGRTVAAHQTETARPGVRAYWFPPSVPGISGLTAYDAAGRKLPAGHAQLGVG